MHTLRVIIFLIMTNSMAVVLAQDLHSPQDGAYIHHGHIPVVISDCKKRPTVDVQIHFSDSQVQHYNFSPYPDVYKGRWIYQLDTQLQNIQTIYFKITCNKKIINIVRKVNDQLNTYDVGHLVSNNFMNKKSAAKLKWDWGPAVAMYGMLRLAQHPHTNNQSIVNFAYDFQMHHMLKGRPKINWADRAAPALVSDWLSRKYNINVFDQATQSVMEWITNAPRNAINSLDHFGTWWPSHFYPSSIWVDSLMMWGILGAQYKDDPILNIWATNQTLIFANKLRDPDTGTYFHAYHVAKSHPLPKKNVPWLRGNGWVMANLVILLEDPEIPFRQTLIELFQSLASDIKSYQLPSGFYDTLISTPGKGYEESSGSALVAFAFFKGYHLGLLSTSYYQSAQKTARAISARLRPSPTGYSLGEISGPTMPYTASIYRVIPRARDLSYGIGAFAMMCSEWR